MSHSYKDVLCFIISEGGMLYWEGRNAIKWCLLMGVGVLGVVGS